MAKEKEIRVGDFVRVRMSGIMEPADTAYVVKEGTKEGKYRIVQTIGTWQHRMTLKKEKLLRL